MLAKRRPLQLTSLGSEVNLLGIAIGAPDTDLSGRSRRGTDGWRLKVAPVRILGCFPCNSAALSCCTGLHSRRLTPSCASPLADGTEVVCTQSLHSGETELQVRSPVLIFHTVF